MSSRLLPLPGGSCRPFFNPTTTGEIIHTNEAAHQQFQRVDGGGEAQSYSMLVCADDALQMGRLLANAPVHPQHTAKMRLQTANGERRGYLTKPVSPERLLQEMTRFLPAFYMS